MNYDELIKRINNSTNQKRNYLKGKCFCYQNAKPSLYIPSKNCPINRDGLLLFCDRCCNKRYVKRKLTEKELFTIKIL